ncbi:MAG TPA: glycosyltransferase family 4 protein [Caulobacteraceae bacterium]|jgi:UDP-glucose:(heptosyl)LPS alpha-1,3-glucosyltransferase
MTESSPQRRVALVIFRLAPAGGLEQHCLRLAAILCRRGAAVTLVTTRAPDGPLPEGAALELVAARGSSNHGHLAAFAADAARAVAGRFERAVAFHAIPGFDAIFVADPSRSRPAGLRALLPRYRAYAALERAALAPDGAQLVLTLSGAQREAFLANTGAAPERLALLPPTVDRKRAAAPPTPAQKVAARGRLGLPGAGPVWLWIGLQPQTKGLDRALAALAGVPEARLIVCGLDPKSRAGAAMAALAERLGVASRTAWLGFASEGTLADAFAAADLLLHPSRADVTGTVILEALAAGLPAITTAVCGYGEHVVAADAGAVLPEPFSAAALSRALAGATPDALARWSANAAAYASRDALYSGLERAADLILAAAPRSGP